MTSICFPSKNRPIRSLGICLGASTISIVQLEQDYAPSDSNKNNNRSRPRILDFSLHTHEGNPKQTLVSALASMDLSAFDSIAATGRRFRHHIELTSIPEPEAVEYAYQYVKSPDINSPAVISAGGETFMVYTMNRFGQIANVITGNKCASGTGEFFLQQLRRMNVSLEQAAQWTVKEIPYQVSGRCSVFCKSDCTHATNKGIPKSRVTAGLCRMMADKILGLLTKVERKNIMIVGGTARNHMMIEYLKTDIDNLIVPDAAPYFEALGAALWALEHPSVPVSHVSSLFKSNVSQFDTLPALKNFKDRIEFKSMETGTCQAGNECILGLDVGSTTTKAILLRTTDHAMLASVYLRTNGDPIRAARECYQSIWDQIDAKIDPAALSIIGLGVCGSGRQIAGLHALTDNVINEIVAHAAAAVHFDPQVDTLFEIGGQDAKYTYITNGVPSDYAMNEACSAGTGSFLEESAYESLGIPMDRIANIAMGGHCPPNFNDQCAAFIASDIKNAIHEGIAQENIVAGLVYSICMNYTNRVKGNRPVGNKVFMQGGVCYNRAVPHAMAALSGKPIVVPPEPGLMGAFGVALEVHKRLDMGLTSKTGIDLKVLANRDVSYGQSFICQGGKEKCDRRCEINRIHLEGKTYPFGGACNRYYNLRHHIRFDIDTLDMVRMRQKLVFETSDPDVVDQKEKKGRIGINRSYMVNTYYPLYSTFFTMLGFEPILPDLPSQKGIDRKNAPFCYPGELSHGFFYSLLQENKPLDFLFLPHFRSIASSDDGQRAVVCPLLQGEPFYLKTAFKKEIQSLEESGTRLLTPLIDFEGGLENAKAAFIKTGLRVKGKRKEVDIAFQRAVEQQTRCLNRMKSIGKTFMEELEATPDRFAVVLFGRAYNGFVEEAHMGIPNKFASRGIPVIPFDFIIPDDQNNWHHMYWGMGQLILKTAQYVHHHPQLFGVYITNFSCGPDSFLLGYFRTIMGRKPSLTLELDSHSADAGLETRVEAFLDIITAYRQLATENKIINTPSTFIPAKTIMNNGLPLVISSAGKSLPITDPRISLLFPSMGKLSSEALAAIFRSKGFHPVVHPPADEAILKLGRAHTSCKECLPLILTTGTLLNYVFNEKKTDEILVYFMTTGSGPCRFGQYAIYMEELIKRLELPDVTLLSLSSENSYAGLEKDIQIKSFWAIVISDVMEDIRSMILANAVNKESAIYIFEAEWLKVIALLEEGVFSKIETQLEQTALELSRIPTIVPAERVPKILLTGEIFVRRDPISRQHLMEHLAEKGFATICSPVTEWMHYCDFLQKNGLNGHSSSMTDKLKLIMKSGVMARYEKRIKHLLSFSGMVHPEPIDIETIINTASPYLSPNLAGEAILTIGSAINDIATHTCGVIAIGPFGCMPNRLSESILNEVMTVDEKRKRNGKRFRQIEAFDGIADLPFLAIESDGSPFPQLINAKTEAFLLRATRLHEQMMKGAINDQGVSLQKTGGVT